MPAWSDPGPDHRLWLGASSYFLVLPTSSLGPIFPRTSTLIWEDFAFVNQLPLKIPLPNSIPLEIRILKYEFRGIQAGIYSIPLGVCLLLAVYPLSVAFCPQWNKVIDIILPNFQCCGRMKENTREQMDSKHGNKLVVDFIPSSWTSAEEEVGFLPMG